MPSIPASAIVNVVPNTLGAGGTGLDLSGLMLTNSTRLPIGVVQSFSSAATVATYFGAGSLEAIKAAVYFSAFDNSNIKPAAMLFAQYPRVAVPAFLRGGNAGTMTLAQLQALTGTVIVTVNGNVASSGSINLSAASSFSAAAALIQASLAYNDAVVTASMTGGVMTVTTASGVLAAGQTLVGAGVPVGTTILSLGTGTGGNGTYNVSSNVTVTSTTISAGALTVAYDSVSGAFVFTGGTPGGTGVMSFATGTLAVPLLLTAATGAVTSPGAYQAGGTLAAPIATPATFMASIVAKAQNFVSFTTIFEPSTADKISFAAWTGSTVNRYLYVLWDTDITVTTPNNTTSAGYAVLQAGYSGVVLVYQPTDLNLGAFVMGSIAAVDFSQRNGRATLAFKGQTGIPASVTDRGVADQLRANGYNFYGSYATAAAQFTFLFPGTITGPFLWIDSYINQVQLNNGFQLDLMNLLTSVKSVPYSAAGYALIEAALHDRILNAVTFGTIRSGVTLAAAQAAGVNAAAGVTISDILSQRGWYLQIVDAQPAVRSARASPPVTFWYVDGQSVQQLNLASVEIQ